MRKLICALALGATLTGCTLGSGDSVAPVPGSGDEIIDQAYPTQNIGTTVGTVIKNYPFTAYINPATGMGTAAQQAITLGDFYNPTGKATYPADSPFGAGTPIPRVLVINAGAVWCGPCKEEAANVLPGKYDQFKPSGMQLLFILFDSVKPGEPASFTDLDNWTGTFDVRYPAAVDPKRNMADIGDPSQFPFNIIVDTTTMRIVESQVGLPPETFWQRIEELLAAK